MPNKSARLLAYVVLLTGCATGLLAPGYIRQAEFLEKTKVKRATAYNQALHWFDKQVQSKPGRPRTEVPDEGVIKMEAAYSCNAFRKDNDLKEYFLGFDLDFAADLQAVSLRFRNLRMENAEGAMVHKPEAQLGSPSHVERIQPCLKKLVSSLLKAVESNTVNW